MIKNSSFNLVKFKLFKAFDDDDDSNSFDEDDAENATFDDETDGYGNGFFQVPEVKFRDLCLAQPASLQKSSRKGLFSALRRKKRHDASQRVDWRNSKTIATALDNDILDDVIELQNASGLFKWGLALETAMGVTREKAEKAFEGFKADVWITALAVAWFRIEQAASKDFWELVVAKAVKIIENEDSKLIEKAENFVRSRK